MYQKVPKYYDHDCRSYLFINKKDPQIKAECHDKYKTYRNLLSTLLKDSKQIYYTKFFESNWNNIRNTWKGIKTTISIKKYYNCNSSFN